MILAVDLTLPAKRLGDDMPRHLSSDRLKKDLVVGVPDVLEDLLYTVFHVASPTLMSSRARATTILALSLSWSPLMPSVKPRRLRSLRRVHSPSAAPRGHGGH